MGFNVNILIMGIGLFSIIFSSSPITAQGLGGGFSNGGSFSSDSFDSNPYSGGFSYPTTPDRTPHVIFDFPTLDEKTEPALPRIAPSNTPLPLHDPYVQPQIPGNEIGYCGNELDVCGPNSTPTNGIPPSLAPNNSALPNNLAPLFNPPLNPRSSNIVEKSNIGFPSVVALVGDNFELCSGVLISNRAILTAAHCLCDREPSKVWIGNSVTPDNSYRVGQNFSKEIIRKKEFYSKDYCEKKQGIDLAAVFLRDEAAIINSSFFDFVYQVEPLSNELYGTVVGFGASDTSSLGGLKRAANLKFEVCSDSHSAEGCFAGDELISFNNNGTDTCKGDSGGPLYLHLKDGKFSLVGLTSRQRGGSSFPYCGDGGIFTNLTTSSVIKWINKIK